MRLEPQPDSGKDRDLPEMFSSGISHGIMGKTHYWLVVDLPILKNMKVNGKDDIPYIMEKKCSKPPTRRR